MILVFVKFSIFVSVIYSCKLLSLYVFSLPSFSEEEKSYIKGTADFFGLNLYSVSYSQHVDYPHDVPWNYATDQEARTSVDPSWVKGMCCDLMKLLSLS